MSEDQDKKTEEPSHKKLRDARKKGQVAKSKEVVSALVLLIATTYFYMFWDNMIHNIQQLIVAPALFYDQDFSTAKYQLASYLLSIALTSIILPFVALLFIVTIMSNVAQFGFLLSAESLTPKPDKINPISGFGRIFTVKTLKETALSAVKIVLISAAIWHVVYEALSGFPSYPEQCDLICYKLLFQKLTLKLVAILIPLFLIMAVIDFIIQKTEFIKQQKMTKDEAKRDHKNTEGDPHIKSNRKSVFFEMMFDDFEDRIKYSRIIITDYTKAVALSYQPGMDLPVIVLKSNNNNVAKLLALARDSNIQIAEDSPLTHILMEDGVLDDYIPKSSIKKVANLMRGA